MLDPIRRWLRGIAVLDKHAGPDGRYEIRSLYLDTHDLRLFHANEREAHERYKVRVRTYPDVPHAPIFLEVKRRTGDVIRKTRVPLDRSAWPSVLDTSQVGEAAAAFADLCHIRQLEPRSLVTYRREAWVSELDDYARVTFDFAIACTPANRWSLTPESPTWHPIDHQIRTGTHASVAVVEMKFAGAPPVWMHRLVHRLDLIRYAFSKYGESIYTLSEPLREWRAAAVGA